MRKFRGAWLAGLGGFALVLSFFVVQGVFVLREFRPQYAIVPLALATVVGGILAAVMVLRATLAQQRGLFRAIVDMAQEFTYYRDTSGRYDYVSPSCERLTGFPPESFYCKPHFFSELILPDDREAWDAHVHHMDERGAPQEIRFRIRHRDGRIRWLNHLCVAVCGEEGGHVGIRSTNLDITERVHAEERLQFQARFDPLTSLPNRRWLKHELDAMLDTASPRPCALLFLDLDRFKNFNDIHGHALGDRLLQAVAQRLQATAADAVLARFGGDEFVLAKPCDPDQVMSWAESLLRALEAPFEVSGHRCYIGASIGFARFPEDGHDAEELIRKADLAMFHAKRGARHRIESFRPEMSEQTSEFLLLETRLREALERDELQVHFQPRTRLSDQRLLGMEALARWHWGGDWISPGRFIPVAEDAGLIDRLTECLLAKAVVQASAWPDLSLSFNLSGRQFLRPDMVSWLHSIVLKSGGQPRNIEFEITERVMLQAPEQALGHVQELKKLGYKLSLDDFGTGYSSLSNLRNMPFDMIKLDGSFVRGMLNNVKDRAVVQAVAMLCRDTGMGLVAEGIETQAQFDLAMALGIDEGQGYFLARPMDGGAMAQFVQTQSAKLPSA